MSDVLLYATGAMLEAIEAGVTSEATGYPIENALDNNLDTVWKPTSTADQTIDVDLGSAFLPTTSAAGRDIFMLTSLLMYGSLPLYTTPMLP